MSMCDELVRIFNHLYTKPPKKTSEWSDKSGDVITTSAVPVIPDLLYIPDVRLCHKVFLLAAAASCFRNLNSEFTKHGAQRHLVDNLNTAAAQTRVEFIWKLFI